MREVFTSFWHLMSEYRLAKLDISKTLLPKEDSSEKEKPDPTRAQSRLESKYCFIGDVESYVYYYYDKHHKSMKKVPKEALLLIFIRKFSPETSRFKSYGNLALHFRKQIDKGETSLPNRLKYYQHLHDLGEDMKQYAEDYFVRIGYIL